jgi:REP element-mobilizing transposase RayT
MGGIIRSHGGIALEINGMPDHVHVLAKLRPDEAVSDLIRDLKANATGWMHKVLPELSEFRWQNGYGGFTVCQSQVERVGLYIRRQDHHHQKISFKDEFTTLLKKNRIEFDERYLWK